MQLPKGFKLREGAEIRGPLPPIITKVLTYLDSTKFGDLLTTFQLSQAVKYSTPSIQGVAAHPALAEYRFTQSSRAILWGSKRTIAELKKQLKKQAE